MFLFAKDFAKQIQADNLNQIIGNDTTILAAAELLAQEEITSYLTQKYDLTNAFQSTPLWDKTLAYKASNRVYLDTTAYNPSTAYVVGQYAVYSGNYYVCISNTTGVFAASAWALINPQYTIYNVAYPYPPFNYNSQYNKGTQVFWKDNTYTCLIATNPLSQNDALQYGQYQGLPLLNVAPDDVNYGVQYWGAPTAYTVPINTLITNTTYWTQGDNRSQQLISICVDITLFHVHSRIASRNIPDLRVARYHEAIAWLKMASRGDVTASLPISQPMQGGRVRYGGNIKSINAY